METLKNILIEAIETGEIIPIKYHGGSQPGTIRQISPVSVDGDKVKARCLASSRVKMFKLSKMELEQNLDLVTYVASQKTEPTSLKEAFKPYENFIRDSGWVISFKNDTAEIFTTLKNGKLRKKSSASIIKIGDDEGVGSRPWIVYTPGEMSTFRNLSAAAKKFILFSKTTTAKFNQFTNS